ncbi:hypothetical protein [Aquipseudomonas ullengensis]|uniref:Uncharacterized protein n=1 Tax=Aquipseudomonas ullengensis TaxID=2759166 RepID=A0A7W4LIP0_9GAMM|nr:hypothetical protein [Pseudomonas ullengensis]MBB2493899.1 hypothetical protein [Pseudomonas ullengensis]
MRSLLMVIVLGAGIAGCAGDASRSSTCEVLSPPQIILPTTQDDQRVETQSSGDPTEGGSAQQNCP